MSLCDRRPLFTTVSLALAGLLFIAFPVSRPWGDKEDLSQVGEGPAADAFASHAWLISHTFGIFAITFLAIGFWGLRLHLAHTSVARSIGVGAILALLGAGMLLPYFGMETFGLHFLANNFEASEAWALADDLRGHGLAITLFGIGLIVLAVGAILVAIAISRDGSINRWAGYVMAGCLVLYLPQFFFPPFARVTHGLLLGLALLWMAWSAWQSKPKVDAKST